jgi:hypothetical protein
MNHIQNNEQLRADLFPSHSAEILRATLQVARARRRNRAIAQSALVALLMASVSVPLSRHAPAPASNPTVSKPVPRTTVLHSVPFTGGLVSASLAERITTEKGLQGFTTASFQPNVNSINDDQLLSFFQGKAVAILRPAAHHAELFFPQ